jgi:hypothetical protein
MRSVTLWWDQLCFFLRWLKDNKSVFLEDIYPEAAYHDLIAREDKRSERSTHIYRILLIYCIDAQGLVLPLGPEFSDKTIAVLSSSCRDTDYIGWYRHGRILGVLLTGLRSDSASDGCDNLRSRLVDCLRSTRAFSGDHSLQIRVLDQAEHTVFNASVHPVSSSGLKA